MKKTVKLTSVLLSLSLLLCACQKSDDLPEPPSSVSEISDPFENISSDSESTVQSLGDPLDSSGSETSSSSDGGKFDYTDEEQETLNKYNKAVEMLNALSTDLYLDKIEWIDDETFKLPLRLEGRGDPELKFCPLIFCDGILAQTSMDGENFGYSECRINFAEETSKIENITHEIYVKPVFDSGISSHYIALGYIANPDERPDDYWMVSGLLVQNHPIGSVKFDITGHEALCAEMNNSLRAEPSVPLTEEQQNKYQIYTYENANPVQYLSLGDPTDSQTFSKDGKHTDNIILPENSDTAKFGVVVASNQPMRTPYRVTLLVNHKPVKIKGEYDYFSAILEGGKISQTDIEIDGLTDKDIVYAVFCPLPEMWTAREEFRITPVYLVEENK